MDAPAVVSLPGGFGSGPRVRAERVSERVSERVDLRGQATRVWELSDGSLEWVSYSEPVAFAGADGGWVLTDTGVRPDPSRSGWWVSGANAWRAEFGPVLGEGVVVVESDGERIVQRPLAALGGRGADLSVVPVVAGNVVTFVNVWPGTDLRYTVLASGLKEDVVVRERPPVDAASVDVEIIAVRRWR